MRKKMTFVLMLIAVISTGSLSAESRPEGNDAGRENMKIQIRIGTQKFTATMEDNPSAKDFISMLPLTLTLEDYAATEKIAYLPRTLSTAQAPNGVDPGIGDITYYAPWGNLAIFHRDFGYSKGLIRLGKLDSDIEKVAVPGPLTVTFESDQ